MPVDARFKRIEADLAQIALDQADIKQIVALYPAAFTGLEDQVKHTLDASNRILDLIADPNDPDAGIAALAGISKLLDRTEIHDARLLAVEAATAATVGAVDQLRAELKVHDSHVSARVVAAAEGQAKDIHRIAVRQLVLGIGIVVLMLAMVVQQVDSGAVWSLLAFLAGMIARGS